MDVISRVRRDIERNALRARNAIKLVGTPGPKIGEITPYDVVWRIGRSELRHYRGSAPPRLSPPLLIVFSLVSKSYILDLSPGNSFIEHLLDAGFDVYMIDWGIPDARDAQNTLEDYVDEYLPAAVDRLCEHSGAAELNLLGYCFGGVLALLYAAHHPEAPISSLTVLATPVDFSKVTLATTFEPIDLDTVLDENGNIPANVMLRTFQSLAPTAEVTRYVNLWDNLWSDDYVGSYQAMTGWAEDHVPLPGGVARQLSSMLVRDNAMATDRVVLGGDQVHLSDITCPFLTVRAARDTIIPEESTLPLLGLVGSADKSELRLDAGHVGLLVGRTAARTTVPTIIEFLRERSEETP